ncbi:O-fucosyltransferase family protein [Mucilaginibacter boryungensis]|uniref:Alpha-(1,6)-fucosyltransferase N- and catalytic domain-containing protein n=1 Tax=Mucilaginibacter boryungensis TaxID=768480 RepID=A0ABR9XCH5_9SPHI|nr:hypothetical protein [Mucilaginibacter boryungensis]MBE9664867.1 hypothetical protein [Mucilaginibacter boryungensis]
MDKLAAYNRVNRSFAKKYIFNFGSEGGFYSELNNMVFGIIYCLQYKYRFVLYSGDSKFKTDKGWEDFFEPFCDTVDSPFLKKFNKRMQKPKIKVKHYLQWYLFKLFNKDTYLTYDLFNLHFNKDFEKETFDFPELALKGNLRDVSREIVKMVYRFNAGTKAEIEKMIASANLPAQYVSVNIRRGDKDTEWNFISASRYMDEVTKRTSLKDIFVLTDDYRVIEDLQADYPDFRFYTLVNKEERGYVHGDFIKLSAEKKREDMIKLFSSIEIMRASVLSIGAYTTNPGIFLGMTMPEDKFVSVQRTSWYQFERDDVEKDKVK